jgi:di/tricarboxylate transporter
MRKTVNFIIRFVVCAVIIIIVRYALPPIILLFTDDANVATLIALPVCFLAGILTWKYNPFINKDKEDYGYDED